MDTHTDIQHPSASGDHRTLKVSPLPPVADGGEKFISSLLRCQNAFEQSSITLRADTDNIVESNVLRDDCDSLCKRPIYQRNESL